MLYIVTGPPGSGKTTISKGIAESLDKSVLLEGDEFYHHVIGSYTPAWKENNHLDIFWKEVENSIKLYLDNNYDVVFNYIINDKKIIELKEVFKDYDTKFVVLLTDEKTLLERDSIRPEDCRMKERCTILLNSFLERNYNENNKLYTQDLTIEETVKEIINNNKYMI